jgi:peptide/nickel transport system substrate-binding protein
VVVRRGLKNVPTNGIYHWNPGAYFGIYRMDGFWFGQDRRGG